MSSYVDCISAKTVEKALCGLSIQDHPLAVSILKMLLLGDDINDPNNGVLIQYINKVKRDNDDGGFVFDRLNAETISDFIDVLFSIKAQDDAHR